MISYDVRRLDFPPGAPVVDVMEDHDGAYRVWKEAGLRDRILFHFDAHMDFAWIASSPYELLEEDKLAKVFARLRETPYWTVSDTSEEARAHLGNYVHQAIRAGIVREFVWIYPDDPDTGAQQRAVRAELEALSRAAPDVVQVSGATASGVFEGRLYGRTFRALPYSRFAAFVPREEVLLDVDLDFLIVRSLHAATYPFVDVRRPSFWLSPEEFCRALGASGLRYRVVTLAYSVEEGYTPLQLKFLGTELARRLSGALADEDDEIFAVLRRLFPPGTPADGDAAIGRLQSLVESHPDDAALRFNLSMLLLAAGDALGATREYWRAIDADPSYRTRYNHAGPALEALGRLDEARQSYAQMRRLDPDNGHYRRFDFEWRRARRQWTQALALGTKLLGEGIDEWAVRMGLAECCLELRRYEHARTHLERCRALTGGSFQREATMLGLAARAAKGLGCLDDALAAYQRLIQLGRWTAHVHLAVAWLHLRRGNLYKARKHLGKAVRRGCLSSIVRVVRACRSIGRRRWRFET
jgi:tetratricopeptide (TPR) repeat protein